MVRSQSCIFPYETSYQKCGPLSCCSALNLVVAHTEHWDRQVNQVRGIRFCLWALEVRDERRWSAASGSPGRVPLLLLVVGGLTPSREPWSMEKAGKSSQLHPGVLCSLCSGRGVRCRLPAPSSSGAAALSDILNQRPFLLFAHFRGLLLHAIK